MKRFDRTWPTAIGAIGLGTFLGWATFGQHVGYEDSHSFDYTIEVPAGRPTPSAETQTSVRVGEHQLGAVIRHVPTDVLLDRLRSNEDHVLRRNAAIMLGSHPDPEHVMGALTIAMRSDEHVEVRFKAAESLGRLDSWVAVAPLRSAATLDSDLRVREAAVAALGHIAHAEAIPTLLQVLANDPSEDVRAQAEIALRRIADGQAQPSPLQNGYPGR